MGAGAGRRSDSDRRRRRDRHRQRFRHGDRDRRRDRPAGQSETGATGKADADSKDAVDVDDRRRGRRLRHRRRKAGLRRRGDGPAATPVEPRPTTTPVAPVRSPRAVRARRRRPDLEFRQRISQLSDPRAGRSQPLTAKKGETVYLRAFSRSGDELHVHGYDIDRSRSGEQDRRSSSSRPTSTACSRSSCTPTANGGREAQGQSLIQARPMRAVGASVGLIGLILALPGEAAAHGLGGRSDLPLPGWLFAWAAAAVLAISFFALRASLADAEAGDGEPTSALSAARVPRSALRAGRRRGPRRSSSTRASPATRTPLEHRPDVHLRVRVVDAADRLGDLRRRLPRVQSVAGDRADWSAG